MATFSVQFTFVANTKARSSEVNTNFTNVLTILQAHHHDPNIYTNASPLTNSGIAANAQILATQLKYPITLSGLINYLALDNVPAEKGGVGMAKVTAGDLIVGIAGNKYKTLALGGIRQFLRVNIAGTDLEYVDTPAGNYGEVNAGENLAQYNPVYIEPSDSLVYKAHGYKEINSVSSHTFPTTFVGRIAKLSDTQFLALYHNGTTTLSVGVYTTATGAAVDTETVSTAFDQSPTVSSANRPAATVCRLSDTTFVVIYAHTTNSDLYFRTGSISGSTITMDTETAYPGSLDLCFSLESCPGASNGKVVFSYFDGTSEPGSGGTFTPKLSYLTVSTNSITVTTNISGAAIGSSPYNSDPAWSAVTFTNGIAYGLFCCADSGNQRQIKYNWINTFDSSTGADIQTFNLESQTGSGVQTVYSQYRPSFVGHDGKAYFGWATNNAANFVNTKTVLEINQIGCKCIYQYATVRLAGDDTESALPMVGNECGVVVFGFPDNGQSTLTETIYIQKGRVYSFNRFSSSFPTSGIFYSNLKDEVVFGNDGSYLKTWRLPTPIDGFVGSAVTAGQPAAISINTVTMTGLTANAKYFLKDTYSAIGDLDLSGVIPVGQALTSTLMRFRD